MSQVKRSASDALLFVCFASAFAGAVLHMGLIFASGVNLFLMNKLGLALAAWNVSPALTLLSILLVFGGVIGAVALTRK